MAARSTALLAAATLFCSQVAAAADGSGGGDDEVCKADGSCPPGSSGGGPFWKKRGGNDLATSSTPHTAQVDLTAPPTWTWPNTDDEIQRHSVSIDGEGNIYKVTAQGWVRKFSSDGQVVWSFRSEKRAGRILTDLNLHDGVIYFMTTGNVSTGKPEELGRMLGGWLFALGMQSGELVWQRALPEYESEGDSRTVFAANGVLLVSMRDPKVARRFGGNNVVVASKVSDGSHLWDYDVGGTVWNFMPSSPGDGSVIFAANDGRAHRLDIQTGKAIWKASYPAVVDMVYSTGGGVLGPDGTLFYVATNYYTTNEGAAATPFEPLAPCRPAKPVDGDPSAEGDLVTNKFMQESVQFAFMCLPDPGCSVTERCPEGPGLFLVYRVENGQIVQSRRSKLMLNQYPGVAEVDNQVQVVLGMGSNPPLVIGFFMHLQATLPSFLNFFSVHVALFKLQYNFAWARRLFGIPGLNHNLVAAFDGDTGKMLWSYLEKPWDKFSSAGDEEGFVRRMQAAQEDDRIEAICGPDSWAIPLIAGDGTVYAGSGISGNLYAIRDADGDGEIGPAEVSTFEAGQAFLNSPSLAPGMLVVSPCWGPMYVWKSSDA